MENTSKSFSDYIVEIVIACTTPPGYSKAEELFEALVKKVDEETQGQEASDKVLAAYEVLENAYKKFQSEPDNFARDGKNIQRKVYELLLKAETIYKRTRCKNFHCSSEKEERCA